jgi:septum formation protein
MGTVPGAMKWPPLMLASASPRRRWLLEMLEADFVVSAPGIDESTSRFSDPAGAARHWAGAKARAAARCSRAGRHRIILAADTVVSYRHHILGKPVDRNDAGRMLRLLSGRWHQVYTGVCLLDPRTGRSVSGCEMSRVQFRPLSAERIARYIASGEPMDKAGAYGIQGLGALLVRRIAGCFYNVMGLPLARVDALLRRMMP